MRSPDRKTRIKGNRVIHTPKGAMFHGEVYEPPRGLTVEEGEKQRVGSKIQQRQTREAAQREPSKRRPKSDELTAPPFSKRGKAR